MEVTCSHSHRKVSEVLSGSQSFWECVVGEAARGLLVSRASGIQASGRRFPRGPLGFVKCPVEPEKGEGS